MAFNDSASPKGMFLSRRKLLGAASLGLAGMAAPAILRPASAEDRRIVIRVSGGDLTKAYQEEIAKPFTKATGIDVVMVTSGQSPLNMIKGMVDTKTYSWDMAEFAVLSTLILGDGYLEPLGLDHDTNVASIPSALRSPVYMPLYFYPNVFGYRSEAFKGRAAPQSWADFYDIRNFPGRRSLRRTALDTLETALLADGVAPKDLYPLDVDRAFRKLSSVKKDIAVWWESSPQSSHVLATGEVDMVATWSQRLQPVVDADPSVKIVWNDGYYNTAGWGILRGTPKADLCREFIRFSLDPERLAAWTPRVAVGPIIPKALDFIPADKRSRVPSAPDIYSRLFPVDQAFWAANRPKLEERFDAWLLS